MDDISLSAKGYDKNSFCGYCPRSELCKLIEKTLGNSSSHTSEEQQKIIEFMIEELESLGYKYPIGQKSCRIAWMNSEELSGLLSRIRRLKEIS